VTLKTKLLLWLGAGATGVMATVPLFVFGSVETQNVWWPVVLPSVMMGYLAIGGLPAREALVEVTMSTLTILALNFVRLYPRNPAGWAFLLTVAIPGSILGWRQRRLNQTRRG
jgi:hypothetical protein